MRQEITRMKDTDFCGSCCIFYLFLVIMFDIIPQKVASMPYIKLYGKECHSLSYTFWVLSELNWKELGGKGENLVFGKHFVNVSVLPKQTDSFHAQTQSYGVGQAEGINAVSIWISGSFLVLFTIILLEQWASPVQFGSQSLPAGRETRPLRCGEKSVGDKLECAKNSNVNAQETATFIMLPVKVFKLAFLPLNSQLLEACHC